MLWLVMGRVVAGACNGCGVVDCGWYCGLWMYWEGFEAGVGGEDAAGSGWPGGCLEWWLIGGGVCLDCILLAGDLCV